MDYSPLEQVYIEHQTGQSKAVVVRRRYPPGGTVTGLSGLRQRGAYQELPVDVFLVPPSDTRQLQERGAHGSGTRTIYSTTDFVTTDADVDQPADVVFTTDSKAWTVSSVNDWRPSLGYEVLLSYTGRRKGEAPFDA